MHDITEKRVDLVLGIIKVIKRGNGPEFDKTFYREMMKMKERGQNLWYTEGEENFYRLIAND